MRNILEKHKNTFRSPNRLERAVTLIVVRLVSSFWKNTMLFLEVCSFEVNKAFYLLKRDNPIRTNRHSKDIRVFLARNCFYHLSESEFSPEKYVLDDTFHSWVNGKASLQTFFWDVNRKIIGNQWDFFQSIVDYQPDVVILSSYSEKSFFMPTVRQLSWARKKVGVPFVVLWWDTCSTDFMASIKAFIPVFDLHIVADNPQMKLSEDPLYRESAHKFLCSHTAPYSTFPQPRKRDLDVSFLGHVGSYRSYRGEYIEFLMQNNVAGYYLVMEREMRPDYEKYAEILGRSKICINFSYSVDQDQLKGRVFEVLCSGALLLESRNEQISYFFQDGEEYVSFLGKEDLLEKIHFYLAHNEERERIAANGRRKLLEKYNSNTFWEEVFTRVGLNSSHCGY